MKTRRDFISKSVLSYFSLCLGTKIVFAENLKNGFIPVILNTDDAYSMAGKHKDLIVLNDKPINAETPPHLLDDALTPNNKFFVRNNGIPPRNIDLNSWNLKIEGESAQQKMTFTCQRKPMEIGRCWLCQVDRCSFKRCAELCWLKKRCFLHWLLRKRYPYIRRSR